MQKKKRFAVLSATLALAMVLSMGFGTGIVRADETTASTTAAATAAVKTTTTYKVTAYSVFVRSGPSTSSTVVGYLKQGNTIEVYDISNSKWGRIIYKGQTCYVSLAVCSSVDGTSAPVAGAESSESESSESESSESTEKIEPTESESSESTEKIEPTESDSSESTESEATESESSESTEKIESTESESSEKIESTESESSESESTESESTESESTEQTITVTTYTYKVTASSLNVRTGAGTTYSRLGSYTKGTTVTVLEKSSNGWGKVSYNGSTGWISLSYCSLVSTNTTTKTVTTSDTESDTSVTDQNYKVTASSLNVRSGAGTTYTVLGALTNGTIVTITEVSSNYWGKFNYYGREGWISLKYCTATTAAANLSSTGNDTSSLSVGTWSQVDGVWKYTNASGTVTFSSTNMHKAWTKIASVSSTTKYYIVVDTVACETYVFYGSANKWVPYKLFSCSPGAASTPTKKGTFTIQARGYSFGTSAYTCYYYTQFSGSYLFHSVLYYAGTFNIKDGRLGMNLSHGCVRLALENAKWIYTTIPYGSKVTIY